MPTSDTRVLATLYNIQINDKTLVAIHPSTAPVVDVDLNKRQILLTKTDAYKEFLSVEKDHLAEEKKSFKIEKILLSTKNFKS